MQSNNDASWNVLDENAPKVDSHTTIPETNIEAEK